jgi:hypothetical protein
VCETDISAGRVRCVARRAKLFSRTVANVSGFSLVVIHDLLGLSHMGIREMDGHGRGVRFGLTVPKGMYRFVRGK